MPKFTCQEIDKIFDKIPSVFVDGSLSARGLIVNHLILPEDLGGTDKIVQFIATDISTNTLVNLNQSYTPFNLKSADSPLSRQASCRECQNAVKAARKAGLNRAIKPCKVEILEPDTFL